MGKLGVSHAWAFAVLLIHILSSNSRAEGFEAQGRIKRLSKNTQLAFSMPRPHMDSLLLRSGSHRNPRKGEIGESTALSYYLIWSPGMLQKTLISLAVLVSARLTCHSSFDKLGPLLASPSIFTVIFNSVVMPLLSSACCGIQLIINAMVGVGGCAGFNKWLGPLRPYFLAVLLFATFLSIQSQGNVAILSAKFLVAFLPELIHLCNNRPKKRTIVDAVGLPIQAEIEMLVPAMGCVACINKINTSIQKRGSVHILESKSWLNESEKGGRSRVTFVASSEADATKIADTLVSAVVEAGFDRCTIESLKLSRRQ